MPSDVSFHSRGCWPSLRLRFRSKALRALVGAGRPRAARCPGFPVALFWGGAEGVHRILVGLAHTLWLQLEGLQPHGRVALHADPRRTCSNPDVDGPACRQDDPSRGDRVERVRSVIRGIGAYELRSDDRRHGFDVGQRLRLLARA